MQGKRKRAGRDSGESQRIARVAAYILRRAKLRPVRRSRLEPKIAVVLGTGMGGFADGISSAVRIPYPQIPGFPQTTATSHAGELVIGHADGIPIAVMRGRVHLFEGYAPRETIFPLRVLHQMGVRAVALTSAAGGINLGFKEGMLVAIRDHINLTGANPLAGPNDKRQGPRFPDMTNAYSEKFRAMAREEARRLKIGLPEGVYAGLCGPSYETPAEIRFLRAIGADLVGFSIVMETIAARHMGMEVLGFSAVSNMAAGIEQRELREEEVLAAAERISEKLSRLLHAVLPRMAAMMDSREENRE